MKRNKRNVVLITAGIVIGVVGSFLLFMRLDKWKQQSGVEVVSIERPEAKQGSSSSPLVDTTAPKSTTPEPKASGLVTMEPATSQQNGYKVILEGEKVENATISMEKAAEIAVHNAKNESGSGSGECKVYMSSIKNRGIANGDETWSANVEFGSAFRYEYFISASTGAILSRKDFFKERSDSNRWTLIQADVLSTQEYRVDEHSVGQKGDIKDIQVDIGGAVDCEIVSGGSEFAVNMHYYSDPKYNITYEVKNGRLYIKDNGENQYGNNHFNNHSNQISVITITVPKEASLSAIQLKASLGDMKLLSIEANTITLDAVNGDICVKDCTYKELTGMDTNGDIALDGALDGKTVCNTRNGDIIASCSKAASEYSYLLETNLGDVSAEGKTSESKLEKEGGKNELQLKTSLGDINVEFN